MTDKIITDEQANFEMLKGLVAEYENIISKKAVLRIDYEAACLKLMAPIQAKIDEIMRPIQPRLESLKEDYEGNLEEVKPLEEKYETAIRNRVLKLKKTFSGEMYQCQYVAGGLKLDDGKGLLRDLPEAKKYFKESDPYTKMCIKKGK